MKAWIAKCFRFVVRVTALSMLTAIGIGATVGYFKCREIYAGYLAYKEHKLECGGEKRLMSYLDQMRKDIYQPKRKA